MAVAKAMRMAAQADTEVEWAAVGSGARCMDGAGRMEV
jgi:hypothetical protein